MGQRDEKGTTAGLTCAFSNIGTKNKKNKKYIFFILFFLAI
jgi:hypothetical protein